MFQKTCTADRLVWERVKTQEKVDQQKKYVSLVQRNTSYALKIYRNFFLLFFFIKNKNLESCMESGNCFVQNLKIFLSKSYFLPWLFPENIFRYCHSSVTVCVVNGLVVIKKMLTFYRISIITEDIYVTHHGKRDQSTILSFCKILTCFSAYVQLFITKL